MATNETRRTEETTELIEAVRSGHQLAHGDCTDEDCTGDGCEGFDFCATCEVDWPCPVIQLAAEVERLRARVAEYDKDTQRLDWLEAQRDGDTEFCPPGNHGGRDDEWIIGLRADRRSGRDVKGETVRAAIDAAIAASLAPEANACNA